MYVLMQIVNTLGHLHLQLLVTLFQVLGLMILKLIQIVGLFPMVVTPMDGDYMLMPLMEVEPFLMEFITVQLHTTII